MATIKFFIRPSKKKIDKPVNIYIRFKSGTSVDQTSKSTLFILHQNWSNDTQSIRQRAEIKDKDEFKDKIKNLRRFIEDEFLEYHDKTNLPKDWLKKTIDKFFNPEHYTEEKITLFSFIENYIVQSKNRINPSTGKKIALSTLKKYKTCFNCLKDFSTDTNKTIDFENINLDFYHDFTQYLAQSKQHATNTIGKQIAILKGFLNEATDRGINTKLDFKSHRFKITTEESDSVYLNEIELDEIFNLDLTNNPRLDKVRDLFLVGAHTGCRFSDYTSITPESIKDGFIKIEQIKTGNKVIIPMHPVVKSIIEKYKGELPQAISNQKFNQYIKEVCKKAELDNIEKKTITKGGFKASKTFKKYELVSSHTARRSFATNLYKSGFPSISIMQITGHKSEKAFLKYIKVTPEEHAKLLLQHWQKNGQHLKIV
ncbi:site-specific integrase [Carboxylicivirga sp. A043]|uniref:tyrosine-type recombinase/integrase n=1 Tax=Carboxylicivirga litoralis TaxID=2816963 RepID=UPI0021CB4F68|nr:site-specific integrase [Carboxylicivirga sp. A043]MCU4156857.1 site-specific integrase [Carboxylicivirga sp. A043]